MINNKLITIVKDNQFDKGWTLFAPASFEVERNWQFKKVDLPSVIRLITYCDQVDLLLSEACLPTRVSNELGWVNKYIRINIIAKNKEIVDKYPNIKFQTIKIDESININYIGITGRTNAYYIINDELIEIDDTVEKIYFGSAKPNEKFSSLENAKTLIVCNSNKHHEFNSLISQAKKFNVACSYVINSKYFDRAAYDYSRENNLDLYVSDFVKDVIIVINKDNSISRFSVLDNGFVVLHPIDRVNTFVGELYKNLFLEDNLQTNKIPQGVYSCLNGKNELLDIKDAVTIKRDVNIKEMDDFINEIFDKSITDNHNDYSNKGRTTQYFFTLIPPLFDSSYKESSIYRPIYELHTEWESINSLKFDRVLKEYYEFMSKDIKLVDFISYVQKFSTKLEKMISGHVYRGYYSLLEEVIDVFKKYEDNLLDDCSFMFDEINSESSGTKFSKFDVEIEGYRKTIKEKEALIFMGIDVLSNKRRIEILNKKIEDLLALKEKFEGNAAVRSNKDAESFNSYCKDLLNGVPNTSSDSDSIGKIVNSSESSKLVKLNNFVSKYLNQINNYLVNGLVCLNKMKNVHIPEEYLVYEKDNQRFIAISELSEYDSTTELRKEFSLKCLVRR